MQETKTPVLIVGGGVAGLAAAIELSRRGVQSILVEKTGRLGGHVANFCCKAIEFCVHCGACRLGDLLDEAAKRPEITVLTCASVIEARRREDTWRVRLAPTPMEEHRASLGNSLPKETLALAGTVILAVGFTPFDPSLKSRFGYGRVPGVISALELETMLQHGYLVGPNGVPPEKVAFIQCVGSRDQSVGNLYCSKVCCGYALDMAEVIKSKLPESEISFFHMDVQGYGPGWEFAVKARREQMDFIRGIPGEVRALEGKAEVIFAEPGCQPQKGVYDMVVLSVGLTPAKDSDELTGLFSISRTKDGFLGEDKDMARASDKGVFVAGCAGGPRGIIESIDHAALAATSAFSYLKEGAHA